MKVLVARISAETRVNMAHKLMTEIRLVLNSLKPIRDKSAEGFRAEIYQQILTLQ